MHDGLSDDVSTADDRMHAAAEEKCRSDILEQTIEWLQTRLRSEEQRLLMLDLMTYDCV